LFWNFETYNLDLTSPKWQYFDVQFYQYSNLYPQRPFLANGCYNDQINICYCLKKEGIYVTAFVISQWKAKHILHWHDFYHSEQTAHFMCNKLKSNKMFFGIFHLYLWQALYLIEFYFLFIITLLLRSYIVVAMLCQRCIIVIVWSCNLLYHITIVCPIIKLQLHLHPHQHKTNNHILVM